jgi:hypothetical protein
MELIHTSPEIIKKITEIGRFDDCLFFSSSEYTMCHHNNYFVYEMSVDESQIIARDELYDDEIINDIAVLFKVKTCDAENLLNGTASAFDEEFDFIDRGEVCWDLQAFAGKCAKKMGFVGCSDRDEQGEVFIIPMINKESDLNLIRGNSND